MKTANIFYAGFSYRSGGAYYHALNLSKGLTRYGYKVRIVSLDDLPVYVRYIPHIIQKIGNIFNFPFGYLYKQNTIKYLYKLFFKNTSSIDIFEDIYTYWKSDNKSIVILHALWSDNLQAFNLSELKRRNLECIEARILNNIDTQIITVSVPYRDFIFSRLKTQGLKKEISVVELGVDTSQYISTKNDNKSIIFVGALEERKNVKFLLDVYRELLLIDAYTLTIVGDGPQLSILEEIVSSDNLMTNVNFLGRLTHDEVIVELQKHEYYMHTATKESFSYALLEAKLSGLVTVAYGGLEVPTIFIDVKVDSFDKGMWVNSLLSYKAKNLNFDKSKFTYKEMTQRTLSYLDI